MIGTPALPSYPSDAYQAGNPRLDGVDQYLYDGEGRLCAVSGYGGMIQYIYDADGQRIAKGTITSWSCDSTTNGFLQTSAYLPGPDGEEMTEVDGQNNWVHTDVFTAGQLIATYNNDQQGIHFHLTDWLGTRRMTLSYNGQLQFSCSNLPFGDQQNCSGPGYDVTEHHFTGKERDAESGLDYFGARYYSSNMGRFSSPDPGWFFAADPTNPQTWNQYAYALNNPLSNVDPYGYDCVYLNDAGNGVESNDQNSNSGECGSNGGYWVDGTATHVQLYSNNNDVGLSGHTTDSQGNQTSTDSFYTSATGHLSDIVQQIFPGATGTVELYQLYKNRPRAMLTAQNPVDVWAGCIAGGVPKLALDLSPVGIVPDALNAMQSGSLNPLFNSGDKANDAGNAVDVAGKTAEALSKTLPFLGPVAKHAGPIGMTLSVYKYGRDAYNCAR